MVECVELLCQVQEMEYYSDEPYGSSTNDYQSGIILNVSRNHSSEELIDGEDLLVDYSDIEAVERVFAVVVPMVFGLIVLIGLFGNALVVIVVACYQQMRNTTNLLIINLAVADLLFIVFCVPFTATDYALPSWIFGRVWCSIVQFLVIVCAYASVYTLVFMSCDRFLAVVFPVESLRIRTERNTLIAIAVMWGIILLSCAPTLLAHGLFLYEHNDQNYTACTFLKSEYNFPAFQISFFLTSYIVPLLLVVGLYLCMLKRLWHGVAPGDRSSADNRRKKRATRLVIVVVIIFAVCWGPIQFVLVFKSVDKFESTTGNIIFQIISQILAYMNSCVNPILYAFLSENFRKAFRKVIWCGAEGQNTQRSNSKKKELKDFSKCSRYINNDTETTNAVV